MPRKGLEADRIPDVEGDLAAIKVGGSSI